MANLSDIMNAAQGGQAINNLALQFGLTPEQAQAAINAMMPALSHGMQSQFANPGGMGAIFGHLLQGANQSAFQDPASAQTAQVTQAGQDAISQMFGSGAAATQQIAQHAALVSGVSAAILQKMLPIVASMILGGLFHSMQNQGMGGLLGQLSSAVTQPGGLGGLFGQMMGGAAPQMPQPAAPAGGPLGGMLGGMLGGLFGGAAGAAPGPAQGMPGAFPGMDGGVKAGIDILGSLMRSGVQMSANHQSALQDMLSQIAGGAANRR